MFTPFRLNKTVGEAYNMDLTDSLNTKKALHTLGHLKAPDDGFSPYPDLTMIDGLKSFQRDQGLVADGVMKPDGPTVEKLNAALSMDRTSTVRQPKRNSQDMQVAMADRRRPGQPAFGLEGGGLLRDRFGAIGALGLGTAAAAKIILDQRSNRNELGGPLKTDPSARISPPPRVPPLPGYPAPTGNERMPTKTEYPAEAPLSPPTEIFPDPGERRAVIESFPDQSDELAQAIILENSRGNPATQEDTDYAIVAYDKAVKRWKLDGQHTHGGHAPKTGEYSKERYLKPEGDIRAARTDGTFSIKDKSGEIVDDIQTVDTWADGETPNARERRNDERIGKLKAAKGERGTTIKIPKSRGMIRRDWEKKVDALIEDHFRNRHGPPPDEE